jgi:hypothetical protein
VDASAEVLLDGPVCVASLVISPVAEARGGGGGGGGGARAGGGGGGGDRAGGGGDRKNVRANNSKADTRTNNVRSTSVNNVNRNAAVAALIATSALGQVAMASFIAVLFATQVALLIPLALWLRRRSSRPPHGAPA